ncbi:LCP family protein [Bacillus horti]|uniref:LCP family protein required for cell wall assembly n=1 Tax=Caldalkalibacillus horti TaxID=77523 RepID=A0ABT9W1D4_9BACI|nr:LCP family protein [Bacillus horti]MDQ0166925.1 LCP family protein required for cell wall assembly [Bacillus horti]
MEENRTVSRTRSKRRKLKQKKKKRLTIVGISFLIIFLGAITVFGFFYSKLDQLFAGISETKSSTGQSANAATLDPSLTPVDRNKDEPFAVAIMGTDGRAGGGGYNTDVLLVAVVDPNDKGITMLSIPRDTKAEIPGYSGYRKVNSAYAYGELKRASQERNGEMITETGPSLVKKTLSNLLDIPIDFHVQIGFDGFVDVVDAVDGVRVNVSRSMQYDDPIDGTHIRLEPGEQTLDGKNALDYVRHRLDNRGVSYYSSDFERNERQQEVIRAVIGKLLSIQGMTNLDNVIEAIADNVSTNFTSEQLMELTRSFVSLRTPQISSIETDAYWDSSQSYTIIPESNLIEIRQQLKELLHK